MIPSGVTIDSLIKQLQEAKEHGFVGNEEVIVTNKVCDTTYIFDIEKIEWDNKRVYIYVF